MGPKSDTRDRIEHSIFGPVGPFQAARLGPAGPKSDVDRYIRDRSQCYIRMRTTVFKNYIDQIRLYNCFICLRFCLIISGCQDTNVQVN